MLGRYNLARCCSYLRHEHKLSIMLGLSDFVTCSACFRIRVRGHISALEHCMMKFSTYVHQTNIYTNCERVLRLSDFLMCTKQKDEFWKIPSTGTKE